MAMSSTFGLPSPSGFSHPFVRKHFFLIIPSSGRSKQAFFCIFFIRIASSPTQRSSRTSELTLTSLKDLSGFVGYLGGSGFGSGVSDSPSSCSCMKINSGFMLMRADKSMRQALMTEAEKTRARASTSFMFEFTPWTEWQKTFSDNKSLLRRQRPKNKCFQRPKSALY